jgi:hypothetical protein
MKWQQVTELATSHGLAIYRPYCGFHKLAQITTATGDPVGWTANKAGLAYQSLQSIIQQRGLSKLTDEQAIAAAEQAKSFF